MSATSLTHTPWTSQPKCPVTINLNSPLTSELIYSAYNSQNDYARPPLNYVGSAGVGVRTKVNFSTGRMGCVPIFDGVNSVARFNNLNLQPYRVTTFAFWLWWDTYGTNGLVCNEYLTTAYVADSGFHFQPNASTGNWQINIGQATGSHNANVPFVRPTAAAWHHFVISMNRNVPGSPVTYMYIDGAPATSAGGGVSNLSGGSDWGTSQPLTFFTDSLTTPFGAGRMAHFNVWGRQLQYPEVLAIYQNSAQILNPLEHLRFGRAASASVANRWFLAH